MIKEIELLKNTPDYEDYTLNEVKLTLEEKREFGILKCGGCCSKNKGCSNKKKCCKN